MTNIELIIAIGIVAVVVVFQFFSFWRTKKDIKQLAGLFDNVDNLSLKETSITPYQLRSKESLRDFLANIPNKISDEYTPNAERIKHTDISLIKNTGVSLNERFISIVNRTNEYLCKNTGTSADLTVLEGICDNQKEALEDDIHNSLNVPLYLGLAGTFVGIITGLLGVDFNSLFGNTTIEGGGAVTGMDSLQHLLYGVIVAMCASLLGLAFTVYNTAVSYKKAQSYANEGKDEYMAFIRRELMPVLSNSMASSLSSLKSVLGHFVDKFGRNLDTYADSAELLNDNLEKQHLVLEEINRLSLTRTANKIAETFLQLKDASDSLMVFQSYQKELNTTTKSVSEIVANIQDVMSRFQEFSAGLAVVVQNQNKASELQKQFQEAITVHFPTGSEAREVWRKEFDVFIAEGAEVSKSLSAQLTASTSHIRHFVNENKEFFDSFAKMQEVLSTMVEYTKVQSECYKDLKGEILNLRKDYKDSERESVELHKATIKAIETMTKSLKELGK
jgi:hypothetical protein bfra3_13820